jgi:dTMP kinase
MTRGKFITLEGIDGAGKSSHVDYLCERMRARAIPFVATREPGGTPAAEQMRELILHAPISPLAEALVVFAARRDHVECVIEPALLAGKFVLCDRFTDATYAYQCAGRGLANDAVRTLERLVHPDLQPDATLLFDIDPAVAYARQRARSRTPDKFEREAEEFFRRVRDAYLERAHLEPRRFHVVDASGEIGAVRERLSHVLEKVFA